LSILKYLVADIMITRFGGTLASSDGVGGRNSIEFSLHSVAADAMLRMDGADAPANAVPANDDRTGGEMAGFGSSNLAFALARVFTSPDDRILWDMTLDESVAALMPPRSIRIDTPHASRPAGAVPNESSPGVRPAGCNFTVVPSGSGLSWSLGLVHARTQRQAEHWVTVVVDSQRLAFSATPDMVRQLRLANSRFLLVIYENDTAESGGPVGYPFANPVSMPDMLTGDAWGDLGVCNVGPVDGCDLQALIAALESAKQARLPTVLRVTSPRISRPNAQMPDAAHCSDTRSADCLPFGAAADQNQAGLAKLELLKLAEEDPAFVIVALEKKGKSDWTPIEAVCPERLHRVQSTEGQTLNWCAGVAAGGYRPVVFTSEAVFQQHFDQLVQQFCLPGLPMTLVVESGGESAHLPSRQSGRSAAGLLRLLPNATVMAPANRRELHAMLKLSLASDGVAAVWIADGLSAEEEPPASDAAAVAGELSPGRAQLLSGGRDMGLLAWGPLVGPATTAARKLAEDGTSAAVLSARFLKPLDAGLIRNLTSHVRQLVILESRAVPGGFASAVLELLAEQGIRTPVRVLEFGETLSSSLGRRPDGEALAQTIVDRVRTLPAFGRAVDSFVPVAPLETDSRIVTIDRSTRDRTEEADAPRSDGEAFGFSAESLRSERDLVLGKRLSSDLESWVEVYEQVGRRTRYLWKWCLQGVELTTLPCVLPEWRAHACDTKVLSIILCVLLDDVADERGKSLLLEALLNVMEHREPARLGELSPSEQAYVSVTRQLFHIYEQRIASYPCFDVFEELMEYDFLQYFNTMRYSHLLNRQLCLLNLVEHDLYLPHNMHMMSFATLDLMCAPEFQFNELGKLREAIWHAQCMGRIGNLLSTWKREIAQGDFTSGVFARAVVEGDLTIEQLVQGDVEPIEAAIRAGRHEQYFFERWQYHRERFRLGAAQISSIDLQAALEGHDRFFKMYLGSRGLL
jgi:deoxyxylulose-5-phosphate synthase